ncbi:Endonuclease/exonuclease/phosphatase, partial [Lyophyllum atratum]
PPKTPLDSHHPARLIVISRDGSLAQNRLSERQAVALINDRLAMRNDSKHLRVASARYNHRSNLILMMREDQTGAELKTHADKFIDILTTADAPPNAIELLTDDKRYKVRINGIWTGRENGQIHTPAEIAEELELNNPVIGKVHPLGPPKWMKAEIGTDQIGPVSHNAWTPILPMASVPRGQRPRVMAYVKTRPDFTVTLRSDIAKDLDIQVLDIQQANYPTTTIVNIYSQPRASGSNARRSDASVRLQALRLPQDDPVIISGDWNQHHPDWSITNRPPSAKTQRLVEWLRERGYTLMNEKGVPTYIEHRNRGSKSVIDLTFTNPAASALDATKEWSVDDEITCGSDHHALRWVIDHGSTLIDNVTGTKYNFKDAEPAEWKAAFTGELMKHYDRWQTLQDIGQPRSPDDLDEDVRLLTEAMKVATTETVK